MYIYICIYMYLSLHILYIHVFFILYVKTEREILHILSYWSECSTLFYAHFFICSTPMSKFTLRPC